MDKNLVIYENNKNWMNAFYLYTNLKSGVNVQPVTNKSLKRQIKCPESFIRYVGNKQESTNTNHKQKPCFVFENKLKCFWACLDCETPCSIAAPLI